MKGIILAGGYGSRLYPVTLSTVKQLLPIYDKPLIYYPFSTLLQAGVDDFLIICLPKDEQAFKGLFGDGSDYGVKIQYTTQEKPDGLAMAYVLGEDFINGESVWMILGDNLFFGDKLKDLLKDVESKNEGGTIFAYKVKDPERYGVIEFDDTGKAISIEEKPQEPKSDFAQTGLYYFDGNVSSVAKSQTPSARGELEVTDTAVHYLNEGILRVIPLGTGFVWLDTGTFDAMYNASDFVRVMQERQGILIGSPEIAAYESGFISKEQLQKFGEKMSKTSYGQYLFDYIKEIQL